MRRRPVCALPCMLWLKSPETQTGRPRTSTTQATVDIGEFDIGSEEYMEYLAALAGEITAASKNSPERTDVASHATSAAKDMGEASDANAGVDTAKDPLLQYLEEVAANAGILESTMDSSGPEGGAAERNQITRQLQNQLDEAHLAGDWVRVAQLARRLEHEQQQAAIMEKLDAAKAAGDWALVAKLAQSLTNLKPEL